MQFFAKSEVRDRLVALNGSERGFVPFAQKMVAVQPDAKPVSVNFIAMVIRADRPTPAWLAIAFTRILEDELDLDRDSTLRLVPDWFEMREPEEVS